MLSTGERRLRILISGNCLGGPLEAAAREAVKILDLPSDIRFVRNYVNVDDQPLDGDLADFAGKADFFVQQVGQKVVDPVADLVSKKAKRFRYPAVRLNFLWPFATRPHPLARWDPPFNENGVFNVYLSDAILAGIMEEETDPDRVFERFMAVDPVERIDLDRLFDITRHQFKANEALCDIGLWDELERRFRDERLFWDAGHRPGCFSGPSRKPCWTSSISAPTRPF